MNQAFVSNRVEEAGYTDLEEVVDRFCDREQGILATKEPKEWCFSLLKALAELKRELERNKETMKYSTDIAHYMTSCIEDVMTMLQREKQAPVAKNDIEIANRAIEVIHLLSEVFAGEFEPNEIEQSGSLHVSFEELNQIDGIVCDKEAGTITITDVDNAEHTFPLSQNEDVAHKGGIPRLVLKMLANANRKSRKAELPLNDVDVVARKEQGNEATIEAEAKRLGADPDGIENIGSITFQEFAISRDCDLNECCLSDSGLHYTKRAFEAAKTGRITINEGFDTALHGTMVFWYDDVPLVKGRGMYRLLKFVAEEKADFFEFTPMNTEVDFGIYWLVLAKKMLKKDASAVLLDRAYNLGKQIGQVKPDEKDIFDVLDRVHQEYPFFSFNEEELDEVGVARWLVSKMGKQITRNFRSMYGIRSEFTINRKKNDTVPYKVSLEGHTPSEEFQEQFMQKKEQFLSACARRCSQHEQRN